MNPIAQPIPYRAEFEAPEKDEAETTAALIETMRSISEKTYQDSGHALRSVHAKSHGLLRGEMKVLPNLPDVLRQGLFGKEATYPVVMRLSTPPGDLLPDNVSTPRGLALKIVGVEGTRLPGSEGASTQDFVMVNGPAFQVPNAKAFLRDLKLLAATTDKSVGLKQATSAVLRGAEKVVEALGGESPKLKSMGGHAETHILGETFYSQVPIRYGAYVAKIAVAPVSPALTALTDAPIELGSKPDGLREAVVGFFNHQPGEWELRVQLCADLEKMPIEDASVIWPEDESPYVAVARISIPVQNAWSEARSMAVDEGFAFSPWHGIEAHRPLGSVMRVRKAAYEMSAKFRAQHNHQTIQEPHSLDAIPA